MSISGGRLSKTKLISKKVTYLNFRGLLVPVFTCFTEDDQQALKLQQVERYAKWLKSERITGVLVNSITGEGPALGLNERKLNAEAWWRAVMKTDMVMMIQIGGAPMPDVLELAAHAEQLGVHAVTCLPELFYKPKNIEQLIGYCKIVAKRCNTRPFFYYHIPQFTGVDYRRRRGSARTSRSDWDEDESPDEAGPSGSPVLITSFPSSQFASRPYQLSARFELEPGRLSMQPSTALPGKPIIGQSVSRLKVSRKVLFFDFKGLMVPVFCCFSKENELVVDNVKRYATWLKSHRIDGVLVNSITGEGPALGRTERKIQAEAWWNAVLEVDLMMMLQVGGAPLPDVLELATHAERLGVHAVLCMPELFYKPQSIEQLVGYCKIVAKQCNTRPFFYYHIPCFTGVGFDMAEFCQRAEEQIPNFFGLQYSSNDLDMGSRCLREGRVIMLGSGTLLASGMMLGFESALLSVLNIRPDLGWEIYNAMTNNDMPKAKEKQRLLCELIRYETRNRGMEGWVAALKNWFNKEMFDGKGAGFSAGPARKFF